MNFIQLIFQDWHANKGNIKSQVVLIMFRFCHILRMLPSPWWYFFAPILVIYRIVVEWILCIEIPCKTNIGRNLILHHGQALVINDHTTIGENCTLRNSTTIGNKQLKNGGYSGNPWIGDNVDIGANAVIIGPVRIGNNVKIGAGTIVVKDVPPNSITCGNPAYLLKQ